jgi:hypothetical protein
MSVNEMSVRRDMNKEKLIGSGFGALPTLFQLIPLVLHK